MILQCVNNQNNYFLHLYRCVVELCDWCGGVASARGHAPFLWDQGQLLMLLSIRPSPGFLCCVYMLTLITRRHGDVPGTRSPSARDTWTFSLGCSDSDWRRVAEVLLFLLFRGARKRSTDSFGRSLHLHITSVRKSLHTALNGLSPSQ